MRTRLASILALLLSLPCVVFSQQIAIGSYPGPDRGGGPWGITVGPDGALWFTDQLRGKIGRISTAGNAKAYPLPPIAGRFPTGITAGPDGALWFADSGANTIGRITTAGAVTEYPIPSVLASPQWITAGSDGALWFTEEHTGNIGRITMTGTITEYHVPTNPSSPVGIAAGPDGALWFTELDGNNIGRITTSGLIAEYPARTSHSGPWAITAGPDDAMWFTESYGGNIGRITTAGVISEYPLLTPGGSPVPWGIVAGPDGALWFAEEFSYIPSGATKASFHIGRCSTAGVITEYMLPNYPFSAAGPGIVTGPDGELWFAEDYGNRIEEAVFPTANLTVNPTGGVYHTSLTFAGSAFAPDEIVDIYASGVGSGVLANANADASGSFTVTASAPQSPYGPRLFLGVGQTSGRLGAASFGVEPRLIMDPSSGPVGSTTTAQGYGFLSFEQVHVYWQNPNTFLGMASANAEGTVAGTSALSFSVPSGAPTGPNVVYGAAQPGSLPRGTGTFTVQ